MPLWERSSAEEKQRLRQEQQAAEASRQSLEAGGLPIKAIQRLKEEMEKGHPLFTSDLSANELLLIRQQGYQPLSQVMGSSIYHVGTQYIRNSPTWGGEPQMEELTTLSDAHQNAARLALHRLKKEVALVGAHGVVGVRFTQRRYEWGSPLLEYTAIGTAIQLVGKPPPSQPFLSDLSGQDFWTLLQAGYYPAGIVTGYCSYRVALGSMLGKRVVNRFLNYNQNIAPFSQGISEARRLAMGRATAMAHKVKAHGIVGLHIEVDRKISEYEAEGWKVVYKTPEPREWEQKAKSLALTVHFGVIGTAIIAVKKEQIIPAPQPTLTLTDLRPGRYRQNRELTFRDE